MTVLNRQWAERVIGTLLECGAGNFFVSPGARSAPLAAALAQLPREQVVTHFDERGMGFCALGFAKMTGRPAVCVTTSGSAVANLHPSVVEAYYSEVPLVLLTADRPAELRHTGANQTIIQPGLFGPSVVEQIELPCPDESVSPGALTSLVRTAVKMATAYSRGPVHVNCPFREPLLEGSFSDWTAASLHENCHFGRGEERERKAVSCDGVGERFVEQLGALRGLILVGQLSPWEQEDAASSIFALAELLGWPVLADPLSGLSIRKSECLLRYYDVLLHGKNFLMPEAVLHLGGSVVSKRLGRFLSAVGGDRYWNVNASTRRLDPYGQDVTKHDMSVGEFCSAAAAACQTCKNVSWGHQWIKQSEAMEPVFDKTLTNGDAMISEPGVVRTVSQLAPQDSVIFLGNSMPIRDFDMFAGPGRVGVPRVMGNRGASGIDGNIASAFGIARGLNGVVTAVLGDLAVLHDMNSLAFAHSARGRVILVVLNNGGGGIFQFLSFDLPAEARERLLETPHSYDFKHAAGQFRISYVRADDVLGFRRCYQEALEGDDCWLIEVETDRAKNYELHKELLARVR